MRHESIARVVAALALIVSGACVALDRCAPAVAHELRRDLSERVTRARAILLS